MIYKTLVLLLVVSCSTTEKKTESNLDKSIAGCIEGTSQVIKKHIANAQQSPKASDTIKSSCTTLMEKLVPNIPAQEEVYFKHNPKAWGCGLGAGLTLSKIKGRKHVDELVARSKWSEVAMKYCPN